MLGRNIDHAPAVRAGDRRRREQQKMRSEMQTEPAVVERYGSWRGLYSKGERKP